MERRTEDNIRRQIECYLEQYRTNIIKLRYLEDRLRKGIEINDGTGNSSFEERVQSGNISSLDNYVIQKENTIESIEKTINRLKDEIKTVQYILAILTPVERRMVQYKDFQGHTWEYISICSHASVRTCQRIRDNAYDRMIDFVNDVGGIEIVKDIERI